MGDTEVAVLRKHILQRATASLSFAASTLQRATASLSFAAGVFSSSADLSSFLSIFMSLFAFNSRSVGYLLPSGGD